MSKADVLRRMDQQPPVRNGEFVATATVLQISQLAVSGPYVGDFQIIGNGRLIIGEHPDIGTRVILARNGLFGYNTAGVLTFGLWTQGDPTHTGGDWFAGREAGNYIAYSQNDGTLGMYTPAGASFLAKSDGSLQAGSADGAHMLWNSASQALEIRNGETVHISLESNGNASFEGHVFAAGGRIYGQMQVDGLLRAGHVDGPSVSMGAFSRIDGSALTESSEIIATNAQNLPWFHVVAGGGTPGGGWFQLGNPGDYQQRLTYDGDRLTLDGDIYARGGELGDLTLIGDLTLTTGSLTMDTVTIDNIGITFDAILGKYNGGGLRWMDEDTSTEYLCIGTQVDLGSITANAINSSNIPLLITSDDDIELTPGSGDAVIVNGTTTLGDGGGTNYARFDATGHLTLAGTAKPWNAVLIEPSARTTGTNAPTFEKWYDDAAGTSRGVYLYSFDDANVGSEKEVFFALQMPHSWDGGNIQFHVHWIGAVADTTATPRWGLEYVWKEPGGVFGDTMIMYATGNHLNEADITANKHYITAFTALAPGSTADALSSVLIGRLFRDSANAADTYNAAGAKCGLLYIDAHYQMARLGSIDGY